MNKVEMKEKLLKVWHGIQKMGFWVILVMACGFYFGIVYSAKQIESKVGEAITLGNFLYPTADAKGIKRTTTFDITERVAQ